MQFIVASLVAENGAPKKSAFRFFFFNILLFSQAVLTFGVKGQFISECLYEVIVSPKVRTKNRQYFCPHYIGQKSWQFFVRTLGETMTSETHSEIVWPLAACPSKNGQSEEKLCHQIIIETAVESWKEIPKKWRVLFPSLSEWWVGFANMSVFCNFPSARSIPIIFI